MYNLIHDDCLNALKSMPDCSVDSIVTDPPYGLSFMGKRWDHDVPSVDVWRECLRVLKPGGHLLSFGGSRTYHRLAVNVEDAGFEIRDQIMWLYGSGFPKSHDVSKGIDKAAGTEREVIDRRSVAVGFDTKKQGGGGWAAGEVLVTAPATEAARQWQGWGTALKPAHEPIVMARKPLIGTVAANVLEYGTGAINVDGCRVETSENLNGGAYAKEGGRTESQSLHGGTGMNVAGKTVGKDFEQPIGRWPANVIHDGSDEVVAGFPDCKPAASRTKRDDRSFKPGTDFQSGEAPLQADPVYNDSGSAARFFYCAKASRADRGPGNTHPTVKPTDMMAYLCRLVTPPGGTILDPFMGSGSTGKAALRERFRFIGVEMDQGYFEIARNRIKGAHDAIQKDVSG